MSAFYYFSVLSREILCFFHENVISHRNPVQCSVVKTCVNIHNDAKIEAQNHFVQHKHFSNKKIKKRSYVNIQSTSFFRLRLFSRV